MKRLPLILCILLIICPLAFAGPTITGGGKPTVVADTSPQLGGDLDLNGYNIDFPTTANISDVLDEDDMASDSATKLSTQQAIKAFHESGAMDSMNLTLLTAAPASPVAGRIYYVDNSTYDPSNVSGTLNYYCMNTDGTTTYVALVDEDGNFLFSSVEMTTLLASELDDDSDPHLLTVAELKGSQLSNSESVGADEWDFPARTEGWSFKFLIEAAQNVTLDPNGAEQWYFNGNQMAAGEPIVNEAPTVGEEISCSSSESGVYCNSKFTDWAEDTP